MVDVTFPFIILLGGLLVGIVTARVRRHTGWRKAPDILVAAICGPRHGQHDFDVPKFDPRCGIAAFFERQFICGGAS